MATMENRQNKCPWLVVQSVFVLYLASIASCQSAGTISLPLTRATTHGAGLHGQPVVSYYATVNIGTPAKAFNIEFDASLDISFVPHNETSSKAYNLHYDRGFNCKASSTCVDQHRVYITEHQGCKLTGEEAEDSMNFAYAFSNKSRLDQSVVWRHHFLAVNDAREENFKYLPIDGMFALAPQSYPNPEDLISSLHKVKLIENRQFSMFLSDKLDDSPFGGQLVLGGVDTARYEGSLFWHNVSHSNRKFWSIDLNYVILGDRIMNCHANEKCQASISSSVNEIYGPLADVRFIYLILKTTRQDKLEVVDCRKVNEMPKLTFNSAGISYSLPPSKYIKKLASGGTFGDETCYVAILPSTDNHEHQWVLGTNFLENYYTVFDSAYNRISFATLKSSA